MIYEARTYRIARGRVPEFLDAFEDGYKTRRAHSEIVGMLYTEIGELNQVCHIWPYASLAERERVRTEANKDPNWPPKVAYLQETMQSEIFTPLPFSPEMKTGALGPIYEWREYMLAAGGAVELTRRWEAAIEAREKLSPLAIAMVTECGQLNKFVHIWPFESLEHRAEIRREAVAKGIWPPKGEGPDPVLTQANKIMLPASYSPMR